MSDTIQTTGVHVRPELLTVADTVARDKGIDRDEVSDLRMKKRRLERIDRTVARIDHRRGRKPRHRRQGRGQVLGVDDVGLVGNLRGPAVDVVATMNHLRGLWAECWRQYHRLVSAGAQAVSKHFDDVFRSRVGSQKEIGDQYAHGGSF